MRVRRPRACPRHDDQRSAACAATIGPDGTVTPVGRNGLSGTVSGNTADLMVDARPLQLPLHADARLIRASANRPRSHHAAGPFACLGPALGLDHCRLGPHIRCHADPFVTSGRADRRRGDRGDRGRSRRVRRLDGPLRVHHRTRPQAAAVSRRSGRTTRIACRAARARSGWRRRCGTAACSWPALRTRRSSPAWWRCCCASIPAAPPAEILAHQPGIPEGPGPARQPVEQPRQRHRLDGRAASATRRRRSTVDRMTRSERLGDGAGSALFLAAFFAAGAVLTAFLPLWLADRGLSAAAIGQVLGARLAAARGRRSRLGLGRRTGSGGTRLDAVRRRLRRRAAPRCIAGEHGRCLHRRCWSSPAGSPPSALTPLTDALTLALAGAGRLDYGRTRAWGSVSYMVATAAAARCWARRHAAGALAARRRLRRGRAAGPALPPSARGAAPAPRPAGPARPGLPRWRCSRTRADPGLARRLLRLRQPALARCRASATRSSAC